MLFPLIGRLIQFVIMFASVKTMTQVLSPTEMGRSALITTTTALFALFLVNPVGMFINRRLHAWLDNGSLRAYFHLYAGYLVMVCLMAAATLCAAPLLGLRIDGMSDAGVVLLVCGSLFFNTIVQTLVPSLNMVQRPRSFVVLTLGTLIASLGASVWLTHLGAPTAQRWLTGTLLGQVLFAGIAYVVFFRDRSTSTRKHVRINPLQVRQMARFCWPIAIAVLLQWMHMQGYRFFLAKEFGLAQLGLYAAGYGVAASLMTAFETLLTTWLQPVFYRMANSADPQQRDGAWSGYAAVMIPASFLGVTALMAASPSLPRILLGPAFRDAGNYVLLGALAEWARMLVSVVSLQAHRHMSTNQLIVPNLVGSVSTYGVLFALIGALGLLAAPLAIFAGSMMVILLLWFVAYRNDPHLTLQWRPLMSLLALCSVATVAALGLQYWLDGKSVPGLALMVCLAIGVVWSSLAWFKLRHLMIRRN